MEHYLARRYLQMAPQEWDRLPWYEQRMYLEGFAEEGLVENAPASPSPAFHTRRDASTPLAERRHRDGTTTIIERDFHYDLSGKPGEFAAVGLREYTIN